METLDGFRTTQFPRGGGPRQHHVRNRHLGRAGRNFGRPVGGSRCLVSEIRACRGVMPERRERLKASHVAYG